MWARRAHYSIQLHVHCHLVQVLWFEQVRRLEGPFAERPRPKLARVGRPLSQGYKRKKTDNPREGWEDGTPPPHRDFKERCVMR